MEEVFNMYSNSRRVNAKDYVMISGVNIRALFDSGCSTCHSLISASAMQDLNIPYIDTDHAIATAKIGSTLKVIGELFTTVTYKDAESEIKFYIVEDLSEDIVFSFSDILQHFLIQYVELLKDKSEMINVIDGEILDPWHEHMEDAEELFDMYEPNIFCGYLDKDYDVAIKEYHELLESNIHKEFKENSRIIELMRSQVALDVFVKKEWTGINQYELDLDVDEDMPKILKPLSRRINPKIYEVARKEFERLCDYFYTDSDSPIASPLVIADKATHPFVRFCGDYKTINKYLKKGHYPIPHIEDEIGRIIGFKIFIDIDLRNAFHQIRLSKKASRLLSIVTPWGQKEPLFMPEGIIGGTQKMQEVLRTIFIDQETEPYTIQIHDNILILANDYDEACLKLERFLQRAFDYGVSLKMEKTKMGFNTVNFFGYVCENNKKYLSNERKEAISSIPFPSNENSAKNKKSMQSLLGCGVYFRNFVPDYALYAQPLYDSTKDSFDWKNMNQVLKLKEHHSIYLDRIVHAQELFYPDYTLQWILQTDACISGLGGVLLQVKDGILQPIYFISKAHSKAAQKWSTIQQEGHAIYYCVKKLAHLLYGKEFLIETDHNNLRYMEASLNPMIIRMCLYLRAFNFKIRHISGPKNKMADYLSRIHEDCTNNNAVILLSDSALDCLKQVHNTKEGHFAVDRTWKKLNEVFPGHSISIEQVREFISECDGCLKNRQKSQKDQITPIYRTLPKLHTMHIIGIDYLSISPASKKGNNGLYVVRNLTTKLTDIYPATSHDAQQAATSLYQYITTYGLFECIISDPGSDFTSKLVKELNKLLGIQHYISIVDRHESNGVERVNKEIIRHLRDYVYDTRIIDNWDNVIPLCTIKYFLNYMISSETGISPYEATFGSSAAYQQKLLEVPADFPKNNALLTLLNDSILAANTVLSEHIDKLDKQRTANNIPQSYVPGDYIMYKVKDSKLKLKSPMLGPYKVISQENNNITCKHPCKNHNQILHADSVYIFYGTEEQALDVALRDDDQFFVTSILNYRGNPEKRSDMQFLILYQDQSTHWVSYSSDINTTEAYEKFCSTYPELQILLQHSSQQSAYLRTLNAKNFPINIQHTSAFMNLRAYGAPWYDSQKLDNLPYIVPCQLRKIIKNKLQVEVPLFSDGTFTFDYKSFFYYIYLDRPTFSHILVNEKICNDNNW